MNLVLELESVGAAWNLSPVAVFNKSSNSYTTMLRLELKLPSRKKPISLNFSPNKRGLSSQEMLAYAIRGLKVEKSFDKRWAYYCGDVPVECSALSIENVQQSILEGLSTAAHPLAASLYVSLSNLRSNQSEAIWIHLTSTLSGDITVRKGTALRRWVALSTLDALRHALREQLEDENLSSEEQGLLYPALYEARFLSYQDWMHSALTTLFVDKSA